MFKLLQLKYECIEVKTEVRNKFEKKKVVHDTKNHICQDDLEKEGLNLEIVCHLLFS